MGFQLPTARLFALDELAAALHVVRGRPSPRRIVSSIKFALQLPADCSPRDWQKLQRELDVVLPPRESCGWETVFDAADFLATKRPEWERPFDRSLTAWRNAQIFAGVREIVVEQLCVPAAAVHREASFANDLGAD